MEQHAVPQDITGFKFKLVGDMTVKQFGELAFGAVMAYIFFASNWNPILKWPLVIFFTFLGFALAFVPIEERPLDIWIINFFRAIYRPTYYVWKKDTGLVSATPLATISAQQREITPLSMPPLNLSPQVQLWPTGNSSPSPKKMEEAPPKEEKKVETKEGVVKEEEKKAPEEPSETEVKPTAVVTPAAAESKKPLVPPISVEELARIREEKLKGLAGAKRVEEVKSINTTETPTQKPGEVVTIDKLVKLRSDLSAQKDETSASKLSESEAQINELIERNKQLVMQIDEIKNKLVLASAGSDNTNLQKTLDELTEQKNKLSAEITKLREQITAQRVAPLATPEYQQPAVEKKPQVRVVERSAQRQSNITLTELPNVINGLVLGENGMPIDGVILIIKDKAGNSIRAFKTNKVGQFIISTPLENGTYYLELEKQGLDFDVLEITLTGQIMEPLEIRPKKPAPAMQPVTI